MENEIIKQTENRNNQIRLLIAESHKRLESINEIGGCDIPVSEALSNVKSAIFGLEDSMQAKYIFLS